MADNETVCAIIPALNEAEAIVHVVAALRRLRNEAGRPLIGRVIVADNGSTDGTAALARAAGAVVVHELRRGYGYACRAAVTAACDAQILLFVDGDNSIVIDETPRLLSALATGADLVIGSRVNVDPGAMTPPQYFGNALACRMMRLIWRAPVSDLGPFRAIRKRAFDGLDMQEMTYGWTIEMQLKAFQRGLRIIEVPVSLRCRLGRSKVSGTVRGVVGAGLSIFSVIARFWWRERFRLSSHRV
jgi:glycosyltransferase involved in cell wall biosynthesis